MKETDFNQDGIFKLVPKFGINASMCPEFMLKYNDDSVE
jgi:hypothetical protein